LDVWPLVKVLL